MQRVEFSRTPNMKLLLPFLPGIRLPSVPGLNTWHRGWNIASQGSWPLLWCLEFFTTQTGLNDWLVDHLWLLSASGSASRLHPKSRYWFLLWLHFVGPRKWVTDSHFKSPCWDYLLRTKAPKQTKTLLSVMTFQKNRTELRPWSQGQRPDLLLKETRVSILHISQ